MDFVEKFPWLSLCLFLSVLAEPAVKIFTIFSGGKVDNVLIKDYV